MASRGRRMKDVIGQSEPPVLEECNPIPYNRRLRDITNINSMEYNVTTLPSQFNYQGGQGSGHKASSNNVTLQSQINYQGGQGSVHKDSSINFTTLLSQFNYHGGQGSVHKASSNIGSQCHDLATACLSSDMQYFHHIDDDVDDDDHIAINEDVSMTKAKGRGPSKPWHDWGKGEKIMLEWDGIGNPIGEHANRFGSKIRSYARNGNMFPLFYTRWDANFWKTTLDQIWKEVQANTNAPDRFQKLCYARIAASWKSFKNRIKKKYYDIYETDVERLANKPNEVLPDQWPELVKYWGSETSKNVSSQNKVNRSYLFAYSKTGRTTHASIRAQRIKENLPVDNLSMWLVTRSKDGVYDTSDGAADREAAIKRKLIELPEEDQENPIERERIFREIVGEDGHGHVLLGGVGVEPAPKRMQYSSFAYKSSLDYDVRIAQLESKLEEQQLKHQEEVSRLNEQLTSYAVEIVDLRKDLVELEQRFKENTSTLARGIEWSILARLQNGSLFVRDFEQSSNCPQYSNGDGSTSNI